MPTRTFAGILVSPWQCANSGQFGEGGCHRDLGLFGPEFGEAFKLRSSISMNNMATRQLWRSGTFRWVAGFFGLLEFVDCLD